MNKRLTARALIWVWPGDISWHFISLTPEMSKSLRGSFPKSAMIKVRASIDEVKWETSLFRNRRDSNYIMPIKKDIRKKASLQAGEIVDVEIDILAFGGDEICDK